MNPIFPSILSGNIGDFETKLKTMASLGVQAIHLDVMDGHFVPNLSFGPGMVKGIKSLASFIVDAHLMVDNPKRVVPWFIEADADWISVHAELGREAIECVQTIQGAGKKAGLVINPDTEVDTVFPYLGQVDFCLLMSVFPGYGGQKFIGSTVEKIKKIKAERLRIKANCLIQVDGGINCENVKWVAQAGADLVVVGTALYGADEMKPYLDDLLMAFGER